MPRLLWAAIAVTSLLWLAGCGSGNGSASLPAQNSFPSPSTSSARVRILHVAPDAPNIDVVVDGTPVLTNLTYDDSSRAGYQSIGTGVHQIQINAFHSSPVRTLVSAPESFSTGTDYTLLIVGQVSNSTLQLLLLADDNSAPAAGDIKLRLLNASVKASFFLDVYVTSPGVDITNLYPGRTIQFAAASGYIERSAAPFEVRLTPPGAKTPIVLDTGALTLTAGQIRTGVVLDGPGGFQTILTLLPDKN